MKRWLSFTRAAPRSAERGTPATVLETPKPPAPPTPIADMSAVLLAWLLESEPALHDAPPSSAQTAALHHLDTLTAAPELPPALLSRAPAVIPQLLRLLRQDDASLPAMAQRISADPVLTAEVLRLSRNAFYRTRADPADIEHAIAMLGRDGLHRAIARVVLRPLFDAPSGSLSRRAAARLWEHSTTKASLCASLAVEQGENGFEGYLAGLLHNTGWTVLLRALDGCAGVAPPFGGSFARQLACRKDVLFAQAVRAWRITPPLSALCDDVLRTGLEGAGSPLAAALLRADRATTLKLLAP